MQIRLILFAPLQPTDPFIGKMFETAIYAQWLERLGLARL
jgi:hypothetical protein